LPDPEEDSREETAFEGFSGEETNVVDLIEADEPPPRDALPGVRDIGNDLGILLTEIQIHARKLHDRLAPRDPGHDDLDAIAAAAAGGVELIEQLRTGIRRLEWDAKRS